MRMTFTVGRGAFTAAGVLVGLTCMGCAHPNTYGSPRTIPKGSVQQWAAIEAWSLGGGEFAYKDTDGKPTSTNIPEIILPTFPSYGIRYGATKEFEIGARFANATSIGIDGKVQLLRSQIDISVDPGIQGMVLPYGSGVGYILHLHLPVLVGINLGKAVSLFGSPGIMYSIVGAENFNSDKTAGLGSAGVYARMGVGAQFRFSKDFGITPEFTLMRHLADDAITFGMYGIGINYGAMPRFDDDDQQQQPQQQQPGQPPQPPPGYETTTFGTPTGG